MNTSYLARHSYTLQKKKKKSTAGNFVVDIASSAHRVRTMRENSEQPRTAPLKNARFVHFPCPTRSRSQNTATQVSFPTTSNSKHDSGYSVRDQWQSFFTHRGTFFFPSPPLNTTGQHKMKPAFDTLQQIRVHKHKWVENSIQGTLGATKPSHQRLSNLDARNHTEERVRERERPTLNTFVTGW